ncbi:MAG: hypothetical protein AB1716_01020 [Planctomycetota bacterium]
MQWFSGKRTLIGGALLSIVGLVWNVDMLVHGSNLAAQWFTTQQYEAAAATIAGLTGVALRLAIGKLQ